MFAEQGILNQLYSYAKKRSKVSNVKMMHQITTMSEMQACIFRGCLFYCTCFDA
jgi:hypothetical protein